MSVLLKGLERERIRRGLTQAQLAQLAGLWPSYVSQLETGAKRGGAEVVHRLSAALAGVPVVVDVVGAEPRGAA